MEARRRALQRLHALMAHTVANGCTDDEEVSAARMAGRLADDIMKMTNDADGEPSASQVRAERQSGGYQAALEKTMVEGLLKSAVQEMALSHINQLAPPGRSPGGHAQWLDMRALVGGHLGMVLGVANSPLGRKVLADIVEELVQDGMLPDRLAVASEQ